MIHRCGHERKIVLCLLSLLCLPAALSAIQPVHGFHDLVAGEGLPGYRDGAFVTARFNRPQGLAQSEDGRSLFAADSANHRLRTVQLDRDNEVRTFCGSGEKGLRDGSCKEATFSLPTQLLTLPGGRLLVLDSGNQRFRLVDPNRGVVSTLMIAAEGEQGVAKPLQLEGAQSAVYDVKNDLLYFSEPGVGRVRRYDLSTGRVQNVTWLTPGPAAPAVLGIGGDKLYVSDQTAPEIYRTNLRPVGEPAEFPLEFVSNQGPLVAFADAPDSPLALRGTAPHWVQLSPPRELQMLTTEGEFLSEQPPGRTDLLRLSPGLSPGFIADRRSEGRFFYASPASNMILSLAAYRFEALKNSEYSSGGLFDFEYSRTKPPNTFRILVVGDSRTFFPAPPTPPNRMLSLPKQLELLLNTGSALENHGIQFEVLLAYHSIEVGLTVWPYYVVPKIVDTYDIDLVMTMAFPVLFLDSYHQRPITSEGLPAWNIDPEFLLQNFDSRIGPGVYRKFFDECRQKGHIGTLSSGEMGLITDTGTILQDPQLRQTLVEMLAPGAQALSRKLAESGRRRNRPVRNLLVYTPLLSLDIPPSTDDFRDMWRRVIAGTGIEFLDITAPVRALVPTYFPATEERGGCHETRAGFQLLSQVLAHELMDRRLLPGAVRGAGKQSSPVSR